MKYFFLLLATLLSYDISAQVIPLEVPMQFGYQAVIRNSNNALVVNRRVAVKATILVGGASGTPVFVETHTPTTNANGLINMMIGGGTVVSGSFRSISWVPSAHYLRTVIDPDPLNGSSSDTISTTSQLISVPYAIHSQYAVGANNALFADTANVVRSHQIGDKFGGGIIFSVWRDSTGQHGLIASLQDLGVRAWANSANISVSTTTHNGAANTTAIILAAGTNTAAGLCDNYAGGSFTDWYLPAAAELNMLYNQLFVIQTVLAADNDPLTTGLNGTTYWSSSFCVGVNSAGIGTAFRQSFNSTLTTEAPGVVEPVLQVTSATVRAIRRF